MPSVVDLCNSALDKAGHGAITSLEDNTKAARLCLRNWPLVRDRVLRMHPWNFAVKRTNLAAHETAPDWGRSSPSLLTFCACLKSVTYPQANSNSKTGSSTPTRRSCISATSPASRTPMSMMRCSLTPWPLAWLQNSLNH